jgi:IS4 transposase
MAPQTPDVPRRKPGRPARPSLEVHDLQGFRFFKRLRSLLDVLRSCAPHPNRLLHYDEYAAAVLFYFFNPAITSLRGLQAVTGFDKVQKRLGIRRMSLGSMSESVRLFDPELMAGVFEELAAKAPLRPMDPRLEDLRQVLTAADGTVLRALPRMTWAVWLRDSDRGAKVHVQFEVLRDTATHVEVTAGQASEIERLKGGLQAGRLYVLDRGFRDFDLLQAILEAKSSFVIRLHENAVYEMLEERTRTPEAVAARITSDRLVRLGHNEKARARLAVPVRLVEVNVPKSEPRGLGFRRQRVSSKKTFRVPAGGGYRLLIATDRVDLPADVIALIYQHRWKVELFFRLLKGLMGCGHLLSDSFQGVSIQVYCALIATLLLAEYTGLRPNKRAYELVALYLGGWVSDEELVRALARLQRQAVANKN